MVGESDSSESLDSDHDETLTTGADELSPGVTSVTEMPLQSEREEKGGDKHVHEGMIKNREYEFGVSKDIRGQNEKQQSGGKVVQKELVRYTKSDEGTLRNRNTQKVRNRPGSLDLDEDISYISAPKFNIPSKRRQYSNEEDPTLKPKTPYETGFEEQQSRSDDNLKSDRSNDKNDERRDKDEPLVHATVQSRNTSSAGEELNVDDVLGDVFGTGTRESSLQDENKDDTEKDYIEDKFETKNEELVSEDHSTAGIPGTGEDIKDQNAGGDLEDVLGIAKVDSQSYNIEAGSTFKDKTQEEYSDEVTSDDLQLEEKVYRQTDTAVENSPDQDDLEKQMIKQVENESHIEQYTIGTDVSRDVEEKEFSQDLPSKFDSDRHVLENDDKKDEKTPSVLSRIKNWEIKSVEDRFGSGSNQTRPTFDINIEEEGAIFDGQRNAVKDQHEISLESNEKDITQPQEKDEKQNEDLSLTANVSVEDQTSTVNKESQVKDSIQGELHTSVDVIETPVDAEIELHQESNKKDEISSDNIILGHTNLNNILSADVIMNLKETEMESQEESDDDISSEEVSPGEAKRDDSPTTGINVKLSDDLQDTEVDLQHEHFDDSLDKSSPVENKRPELSFGDVSVETSTSLKETSMELQQESRDESSDTVNTAETIQSNEPSEDITVELSTSREETDIDLKQESYDDDINMDDINPGEIIQNYSLSKDIKEAVYEMRAKIQIPTWRRFYLVFNK